MEDRGPNWPSAVVATGFIAAITIIFVTVYAKDGLDGAIKVWGAIGTLVGVAVGSIPSYFFRQGERKAQENAGKLLQAADEATIKRARDIGFKG